MASRTLHPQEQVPASLLERFTAEEAPTFALVKTQGIVRLWQSNTRPRLVGGEEVKAMPRYHITVGDELDISHMPERNALPNFEHVAREVKLGYAYSDMRFYVAADFDYPDGRRLLHVRLSRPLHRLGTMRRVLKRIRRANPDAYGLEVHSLR